MSLKDTTISNNLPGSNVVGLYDDLGGDDACPCTPDLDDN